MVRPLLLCLLTMSLILPSAHAATVVAADFLTLTYTDSGGTLPYRMFVPKNYSAGTKYPLVLFLHGVGENGNNNTSQLNNRANGAFVFAEQDAHPSFMIAPQNWNGAGGWDSDVLRRQILAVIQKAQTDYNIDKDRIYVVGLSNGGAGTWNQINTHPWLYAAAVPICGWGSATDKIKDIPIWCFHAADDGTVGVASSDNAINGLRNLGGNPIYTRYASGGHNSWGPAFSTPELVSWLFAQRRGVREWTNIPDLRITSPTTNKGLTTTAATINLSGTATDMLPANASSTGITSIDWTNVRSGGTDSGTAGNSTTFSASNIPLTNGSNRIRFIATGTSFKSANGGNTTFTDVLYVYRTTAADAVAPTINITQPATSPFTTTTPIINFTGSASDNVGVVDWLWSSDRGYNGTCQTTWPVFLLPGNNVITITARDGAGNTTTRTVTVVLEVLTGNQPPVVSAGRDQTIVLPVDTSSLDGTVTDDGLAPGNATTTVSWSKVSGPAVSFTNANAVDTTATFSGGAGVYVLRLTASDGVLSQSDDVTVVVGQQRLIFDFGADTANSTGNWNNVNTTTTGAKVTGARDSAGTTTGVNLSLTTAFTGINSNGTTQATFYPTTAQQDSFYVQNTVQGGIQLTGLTSGATYHFSFFASRLTADDRITNYTIGATTVTLDPTDNTSNIVHISNVAGGTVNVTVAADNGTGYGYIGVLDVVRLTSPGGGDTTNPVITVTTPTSNATHSVTAATLNIGGTASDNVGVTQVTWANDRGGSGTATGTTAWSVNGITLQTGQNILTVTARDAVGNTASDTLTVTYTPPDSTNPAVTITTPTSNATHSVTAATLSIGGTASDNVGVTQVTWANNRGGNGTASGTTAWTANGITLQSGQNILTVTARDAASNTATDTLTVTYTPPSDTTNPVVTFATPTSNATHSVTAATLNIGGTASDNVGVTQVTWVNDRGGSGTASGTTAWTVNGITLQTGQNILTVTARDAAGNTATDTLTITYTPPPPANNAPGVSSGPSATPNPALVGVPVSFVVAANDADNDPFTYAWDFGDGSTDNVAAPAHSFASAGAYTVVVTVSDGRGGTATASVSVVVQVDGTDGGNGGGGGGTAPQDSDGDGVSDADETAAGTNPNDPASGPMRALSVSSLQGGAKFGVENKDVCRIAGVIADLPVQFNPNGVAVLLNIGGAVVPFTLNAKGQAKSGLGSLALKLKLTRDKATKSKFFAGGNAAFKAKIAKGTWSDDWADEGLGDSGQSSTMPMNLNVRLTLNGQLYGVTVESLGTIKAGKSASFKKK